MWTAARRIFILLITFCSPSFSSAFDLAHESSERPSIDVESVEVRPAGLPPQTSSMGLPLHWDAQLGGRTGSALIKLKAKIIDTSQDHALVFARIGNSFRLTLNGDVISNRGGFGNEPYDTALRPQFVRLPANLLRVENDILIEIIADRGRKGGLTLPSLGHFAEMMALYRSEYRWRVYAPALVSAVCISLCSIAFLLWLRTRDRRLLYYCLSEFFWAVSASNPLFPDNPIPWPHWGFIVHSSQFLAGSLICILSIIIIGKNRGFFLNLLFFWLFAGLIALWASLGLHIPAIEVIILLVSQLIALAIGFSVILKARQDKSFTIKVLALAYAILCVSIIRDLLVMVFIPYLGIFGSWGSTYGAIYWTRTAWLIIGLAMGLIVAERLQRLSWRVASERNRLIKQLQAQRRRLFVAFEREAVSQRQHAQSEERQRLMRDMHDGLGAELVLSMELASNPASSRQQLIDSIQQAFDHLKLTVDAMQEYGSDIALMLGSLRYRLASRLRAAGIDLTWMVDTLPDIHGWTVEQARDLQMALYEAFSNSIAHSGASQMKLTAQFDASRSEIRVVLWDNGKGFDVSASMESGGRGLRNLQSRMSRLGGSVEFDHKQDGMAVVFRVPTQTSMPMAPPSS